VHVTADSLPPGAGLCSGLRQNSQRRLDSDSCSNGDRPGERRLVAYVVPRETAPEVKDLRVYLKGFLPGYMVPASYVFLERLPLTPNGKLDHKALPVPEASRAARYVTPRNPLEKRLAAIYTEVLGAEVLGRKPVGIEDSFFNLGWHSLLAAQVIGRIKKHFAVELPIQTIFETPVIEGLAKAVEAALIEHIDALPEEKAQRLVEGLEPAEGNRPTR
jgi:acyl carrier protein